MIISSTFFFEPDAGIHADDRKMDPSPTAFAASPFGITKGVLEAGLLTSHSLRPFTYRRITPSTRSPQSEEHKLKRRKSGLLNQLSLGL